MRHEIVANDEYRTPVDYPHLLIDRLTGNTRFVFIWLFIRTVFKARRIARKGLYDSNAWADSSHDVFSIVEKCGGKVHITGLDNFRNHNGPVIFLSNHMSTLETMIFPGIVQPITNVTFVVKEALVKHWAFKDVMISRKPIVLSRENPREDFRNVMEQGPEIIRKGISIIIFPQSTRKSVFVASEFNSLGTKLAARTGVPVVPVAIKTDFWGAGKVSSYLGPIYRDKTVQIAFGKPIEVSGNGRDEHQQVVDFIHDHLAKWGAPVADKLA